MMSTKRDCFNRLLRGQVEKEKAVRSRYYGRVAKSKNQKTGGSYVMYSARNNFITVH